MARAFPPSGAVILDDQVLAPKRPPAQRKRLLAAGRGAPLTTYRVVTTAEIDAYEKPKTLAAVLATKKKKPVGDSFAGEARKAAKLSVSAAPAETFKSIAALIKTLPTDKTMTSLKPPLTTAPTKGRVKEEDRNVRVHAFLYAASRESDNDFHLIIGTAPDASSEIYMTVEISGLPPKNSKHHSALASARTAYKTFFGKQLPGTSYDFYDPPIPIALEGSLFFDINHVKGGHPGPQSLRDKIPTIWEIHPVSQIEFEP